MSLYTAMRRVKFDEAVAEMDRRGKVIEQLEDRLASSVEISNVEISALKKLALISGVLGASLTNAAASREQRSLTRVLIDVVNRADRALESRQPKKEDA